MKKIIIISFIFLSTGHFVFSQNPFVSYKATVYKSGIPGESTTESNTKQETTQEPSQGQKIIAYHLNGDKFIVMSIKVAVDPNTRKLMVIAVKSGGYWKGCWGFPEALPYNDKLVDTFDYKAYLPEIANTIYFSY